MRRNTNQGPYYRELRDQPPPPEMLTSKIFNTSSAFCSCSQYCYYTKLKICICFCDTQNMLKRHLRLGLCPGPGWGSSWRSPADSIVGWGGGHLLPNPHPSSTPLVSRYPRLRRLMSVNFPPIFSVYGHKVR